MTTELTRKEAVRLIKAFYEGLTPNPGEARGQVSRISIDIEDDDGDYFWIGVVHDRDGTSVEFSMSDYYPESYHFNY